MKKKRITDNVFYIQPDSMAGFSSCSGLVVRSKKTVWVDMNIGRDDIRQLLQTDPPDVCMITHYHLDHSVWTRYIRELSDAVVMIPAVEEPYLTDFDYVIKKTAGALGTADPWAAFVRDTLGYKELRSYTCYDRTTALKQIAPELLLMDTPGHSPGHTSFYLPDDKILFSGDMGLDRFGPWYGWTDCSILDFIESLLRLDGLGARVILTSHGGVLKERLRENWMGRIRSLVEREDKVRKMLDDGLKPTAIIEKGVFYLNKDKVKPPMRLFLDMWDRAMLDHHISLIEKGGIRKFFPKIAG